MSGLTTIKVEIAGANEFLSSSPIVTFTEVLNNLNDLPPSVNPRIVGYSYNSAGAAHNVRLVLTPPGSTTGGAEDIPLEIQAGADTVNSFGNFCGPEGIVVPRRYGLESTSQPPAVPGDAVTSGETYQVFFSTNGKADDGTFYLWYQIDGLDGAE